MKTREKRQHMRFDTAVGQTYLQGMRISLNRGGGKSTIVSYVAKEVEELQTKAGIKKPLIADLGCGEGDLLNKIYSKTENAELHGFDYNSYIVDIAKNKYPKIKFHHKNIHSDELKVFKRRKFDMIITVNTIHEIFSFSSGRVHRKEGQRHVVETFKNIYDALEPGGTFILYDGVEHSKPLNTEIEFKLVTSESKKLFHKFVKEYIPIKPEYKVNQKGNMTMSLELFTRFITKTRFLDLVTWQIEREESYQYFNPSEFEIELERIGFNINTIVLLRPRIDMWKSLVKIISPKAIELPFEHILIIAQKN